VGNDKGFNRGFSMSVFLSCYHGVMDISDACVVRLSEMFPQCLVFTVDKTDFSIYRHFGNQSIPLNTPPDV